MAGRVSTQCRGIQLRLGCQRRLSHVRRVLHDDRLIHADHLTAIPALGPERDCLICWFWIHRIGVSAGEQSMCLRSDP